MISSKLLIPITFICLKFFNFCSGNKTAKPAPMVQLNGLSILPQHAIVQNTKNKKLKITVCKVSVPSVLDFIDFIDSKVNVAHSEECGPLHAPRIKVLG